MLLIEFLSLEICQIITLSSVDFRDHKRVMKAAVLFDYGKSSFFGFSLLTIARLVQRGIF